MDVKVGDHAIGKFIGQQIEHTKEDNKKKNRKLKWLGKIMEKDSDEFQSNSEEEKEEDLAEEKDLVYNNMKRMSIHDYKESRQVDIHQTNYVKLLQGTMTEKDYLKHKKSFKHVIH